MDRRSFLRSSSVAIAAAGLAGPGMLAEGKNAKIKDKPEPFKINMPDTPGGLHLRFLGTGGADWRGADKNAAYYRRCSSILLERRILVDFTSYSEDMVPEVCTPGIIFYTHSHSDHYSPSAALKCGVRKAYVGATWFVRAVRDFTAASVETGLPMPQIIPLEVGQRVEEGDIAFTALPSNHGTSDPSEQTLMYLIQKGPVRLMYATDTGGIPFHAARIAGIDKHFKGPEGITGLIMEASMGLDYDEEWHIFNHSSVGTVLRTVHVLQDTGLYHPAEGQPVFLTHMMRRLHGTQEELDATLPSPLVAAYDGLEVCFSA